VSKSVSELLKYLHDNIDPDQLVADYMALTKSERVKFAIDITKMLREEGQTDGKVVIELIYPDEQLPDTGQAAA
tara:strand:+ start:225 stop:446 length:222 start_codon:yes stop_codon:yes gene_type:complete